MLSHEVKIIPEMLLRIFFKRFPKKFVRYAYPDSLTFFHFVFGQFFFVALHFYK